MKSLSIILPISDREKSRRNIDRANLLIQSLLFFWREDQKIDFHVICPDSELDAIKSEFLYLQDNTCFDLHFRDESSIHPSISNAPPGYGIAKHMLIKLAAANFVFTEFYLIFDTDIVPCKFMNTDAFIKDGRALTEYFSYPGGYPWYMNSAKALHIDEETVDLSIPRLFVTPEILSSTIVKSLQNKLGSIESGKDWVDYLIGIFDYRDNHYWTEYTLYDLHGSSLGLFEKFHLPASSEAPLHCMDQGIWKVEDVQSWDPLKAFDGRSPGYFMVLQSITADVVNFDDIKTRVEEALITVHNTSNITSPS